MRLALSLFLVLLLPATAAAAEISFSLDAPEVQFGTPHQASGRLVEGTTSLAGQRIELLGREYPYDGAFKVLATTTTGEGPAPGLTAVTLRSGSGRTHAMLVDDDPRRAPASR